ncbi:uncharacterized protein [Oryza sativa Japonica Group]|uniref:Expressed protein n=3 Tax=Oryza sativa subsp. japonica TaxID=39947 RepID=Q339V3_ORYSJ|nr:uncharacterized protein LOC4348327 [Oryza sativa Japonica Group]ABB47174.2 expressed protein [Oryza sativa Japonica Group]KAF2913023.1 hypothetical protein DAI22_10g056500 [Oryza sativa Japonica Group]BAF26270.1 Os10g0327800 [Oryza sativa Japonica Group]BAG94790.1 unnamed protein product [Oryza sativa Japonica Group]BAT10346.1 Os10g0327800 [Oryza sativa Japonica Group]|eukprot:NP_001064356.1 Os10g0327800 [Oryza sativa Japonica Group]
MQSLSRSTLLGLVRRLRLSSPPSPAPQPRRLLLTASPPPPPPPTTTVCCSRPAAAPGRDARTMAVALAASPDRSMGRESRFRHGWRSLTSSSEEKGALKDVPAAAMLKNRNDNEKKRSRRRKPGITILKNSGHRDGSIFKGNRGWKIDFRIANPDETQFEAMMLSDPGDCKPDEIACVMHQPCPMLQIFSLKLAKTSIDRFPVELYGYIAVRDLMDPLRNYVVRRSRDDTIAVKPGSLIGMTGPKRGIKFCSSALIEYDMRIKTGEQEEDDIQLIDGVLGIFDDLSKPSCKPFRSRIDGVGGAVDITVGLLPSAVEAIFEVSISEVQSCFDLTVCSYAGGLSQQFKIFQGTIGESCGLRRSVVAVMLDGMLHLRFIARRKGSKRDHEIACSIRAKKHGSSTHQLNTELASFLVKVNWSTLPM